MKEPEDSSEYVSYNLDVVIWNAFFLKTGHAYMGIHYHDFIRRLIVRCKQL